MAETKTFLFLNVSSSPTDMRTKASIRNAAQSHAARYSHSRRSWLSPSTRQSNDSSSQTQTDSNNQVQSSTLPLVNVSQPDANESKALRRTNKRQPRWRVAIRQREVSPPASTSRDPAARSSERLSGRERLRDDGEATAFMRIPRHKGNSDPFGCAAIPITAFDYAVMNASFLARVNIIWPSEIYLRRNQESLASGFRKYMPGVLDHAGTAHGVLSEAFSRRAREAKARGLPYESSVRESMKHKLQAMRLLRERIDTFQKTGANVVLNDIRCTSAELGVAEIASGNFAAAQMHYAAVVTALDLLGGWKTVSPVEVDCFLLPIVAHAWFCRSRPVLLPDWWDPGPRPETKPKLPKSTGTTSGLRPLLSRLSTVKPELRRILDQTRGLLEVEELKFSLAASESEEAEKLFRWSHRRKLAVRARNLHHWCDLEENAGGLTPSFDMILCLTVRCFDHAVFEEFYIPPKRLLRPSETLLVELAAGLQSLTRPFHNEDDSHPAPLLRHLTSTEDERRFDMLWIYSVGASVENYLLSLGRLPSPAAQLDRQKDESVAQLFSMRFSRLAKALGFVRFDDLAAFLREEYLYCARLQGEILRRLVDS